MGEVKKEEEGEEEAALAEGVDPILDLRRSSLDEPREGQGELWGGAVRSTGREREWGSVWLNRGGGVEVARGGGA